MANVFVFAETRSGAVRSVAYEAVTAARSFADATGGGTVYAMVVGAPGISAVADSLGQYGADVMLAVEHADLARSSPEVSAATAAAAITEWDCALAIFSATAEGRDLAPRVAVSLDRSLAADVTSIEVSDGAVVVKHPVYTGKAIATMKLTGTPAIVSIRPGAFAAVETPRTQLVESVSPAIDPASARVVVTELGSRTSKVDLGEAPVIVAGGRGLRAAENFALVEALGRCIRQCRRRSNPSGD